MRNMSFKKYVRALGAAAAAVLFADVAAAAGWVHLTPEDRIGGRMISSGYLRGKVVLVDCRDYAKAESAAVARRMQENWATFKMKPFVMLGCHTGSGPRATVERAVKSLGLTYPVYSQARSELLPVEFLMEGYFYVVDATGQILYQGRNEHRASGIIASAIMAWNCAGTSKGWQRNVSYELQELPGRALNDLREFRRQFPQDAAAPKFAQAYARLTANPDVVRLAKLEELTRQAKDYDPQNKAAQRLDPEKLAQAIEAFAYLKQNADPFVAQEAKNCLADLTWAQAALRGGSGR